MQQRDKTLLKKLWETGWAHLYDKLQKRETNIPLFNSISFQSFFGISNNKVDVDKNLSLLTDWAWRCIDYKAFNFAKTNWSLRLRKSRDEFQEIKSHRMYDLFYEVNEEYTQFDLWYLLECAFETVGESNWYVETDKLFGMPVEITPIFPDMGTMRKHRNEYGKIYKYTLQTKGGKEIPFDPYNIFNYRALDLTDSNYGVPLMTKILRRVMADRSIKDHQKSLLENQAVPSGILTTSDTYTAEEFKRELTKFQETYGGAINARKVMFFDGNTKYQVLGLTPVEMDLVNSSNLTRDDIIALSGVPRGKFGLDRSTTVADALMQDISFAKDSLLPHIMKRDNSMSQDFCQKYYRQENGAVLEFVSENIIPDNKTEKADLFIKVGQGGYKVKKEYIAKELGIPENMLIDMDEVTESQLIDLKGQAQEDLKSKTDAKKSLPQGVDSIQDTALNGAQVSSLIEILQNVSDGLLPKPVAINIITNAFPAIGKDKAEKMVNPIKILSPKEKENQA